MGLRQSRHFCVYSFRATSKFDIFHFLFLMQVVRKKLVNLVSGQLSHLERDPHSGTGLTVEHLKSLRPDDIIFPSESYGDPSKPMSGNITYPCMLVMVGSNGCSSLVSNLNIHEVNVYV